MIPQSSDNLLLYSSAFERTESVCLPDKFLKEQCLFARLCVVSHTQNKCLLKELTTTHRSRAVLTSDMPELLRHVRESSENGMSDVTCNLIPGCLKVVVGGHIIFLWILRIRSDLISWRWEEQAAERERTEQEKESPWFSNSAWRILSSGGCSEEVKQLVLLL